MMNSKKLIALLLSALLVLSLLAGCNNSVQPVQTEAPTPAPTEAPKPTAAPTAAPTDAPSPAPVQEQGGLITALLIGFAALAIGLVVAIAVLLLRRRR